MKDTVYVFARAPRLGTVKRRLAAGIGARAALAFHRGMLRATLRRLAADARFRTVVAVTPDAARGPWLHGLTRIAQGPGDLGARMSRVLNRHRRGRVAIVGCDIPDLRADDVAKAFRLLGRVRSCFGPARDGGYWLIALSARRPAKPFAGVRWSTDTALSDTLANFTRHSFGVLRTLRDVDTAEDLQDMRA